MAWWEQFPDYSIKHLLYTFSDHCPILIQLDNLEKRATQTKRNYFRFNADWVLEEHFDEQIQSGWRDELVSLPRKLEGLGKHLRERAIETRTKRAKRKKELTNRLEELSKKDLEDEILSSMMEVKLALNMEADKRAVIGSTGKI